MTPLRNYGSLRTRRGFSLLEVVVVLTILGVVAGVTAPALRDAARKDDLKASAGEIVSLVGRTRRTASDYATRATLTIDVESARYWVFIGTTSGERSVAGGTIPLAAGAELIARESRVTFVFDASGKAFATDLAVRLNGTTAPIIVDPWRGDVRVGAP
jgi:prepilin-type N-terminal cleavage/methylation domain-containing protein